MAIHGVVYIYSNDGGTAIVTFSTQNNRICTLSITDSGLSFKSLYNGVEDGTSTEWVYDGTKKFLGLSKTQGSNSVDNGYGIGNTISFDNMESVSFYIVEGEPVTPTLTYNLTKLNLAAGTYNISVVAKANGYQNAQSETVQFIADQPYVEETNEYGTTMVINRYTEESNEYGTTMIIGGTPTANLITFTIAGTRYQAENGMTYAQWIDSKYNTDRFVASNGFLKDANGAIYGTVPNMTVSNVIKDGDALYMTNGGAA